MIARIRDYIVGLIGVAGFLSSALIVWLLLSPVTEFFSSTDDATFQVVDSQGEAQKAPLTTGWSKLPSVLPWALPMSVVGILAYLWLEKREKSKDALR